MRLKKPSNSAFYDTLNTPLGMLQLIFAEGFLTGVSFQNEHREGILWGQSEISGLVKKELTEYFNGKRTEFTCRTLFIGGTEFERMVWNALKDVPYGETRTYKWLTERTGRPQAFRAAGRALGKNPIPIIVPCHRIIEADGTIGGYSSGIEIKRRLLEIEYYTRLARL